jgi:hypothetical protein
MTTQLTLRREFLQIQDTKYGRVLLTYKSNSKVDDYVFF